MGITHINLELTNACNLRCIMCDIWRETAKHYFTIEMIDKIFSGDILIREVDVTLTGGEIFLHPDLSVLVERICHFRPKGIRTISTNGISKKHVKGFLSNFYSILPDGFSVHISLDGINAHDEQRGVESREKILETIKFLKESYPDIPVKIKFTITPANHFDILKTYIFCRENRLEFRPKIVEYAPHYTNRLFQHELTFTSQQILQIRRDLLLINKELKSSFISDSIDCLLGGDKDRFCPTPLNRAFIMSTGDVFSCIHSKKLGNIHQSSLEAIWNAHIADGQRARVCGDGCGHRVSYHSGGHVMGRKYSH